MDKIDYSKEQLLIISSIYDKNVIVDSIAGSGKTTTSIEIGRYYKNENILIITYNKRQKEILRDKIEDDKIDEVINIIDTKYKNIYTYDKIINGLICIKRLIPSYCNICKRTHNSIDGFIFIKEGKFYLNCRRNEKSTLL